MTGLVAEGLHAGYGSVQVLRGVDLHVGPGEIVAVLGANGAGKSTLLRALSGVLRFRGEARLDGVPIAGATPDQLVRRGLVHVPEGRGTLRRLTVEENLRVAAGSRRDRRSRETALQECLERFPRLRARLRQPAASLSGGEQQQLAVGRALMSDPRVLLLDEPSLGLAPRLVRELLDTLAELRAERAMSIVLVEQNAELALPVADRACVLAHGAVALEGGASEIAADQGVRHAYLGV